MGIRAWSFSPVAPVGAELCMDAQASSSLCQFSLCPSCPSLTFLGVGPYDILRRYSPILNGVPCVMEVGFRVELIKKLFKCKQIGKKRRIAQMSQRPLRTNGSTVRIGYTLTRGISLFPSWEAHFDSLRHVLRHRLPSPGGCCH